MRLFIGSVLVIGLLGLTGCGAGEAVGIVAENLSPTSIISSKNFNLSTEKKIRSTEMKNTEGMTEKEAIALAIVNNLNPENFLGSNDAKYPFGIRVYEGEFTSDVEAFFFMKSLEKDLDSICGRDPEGFSQNFYCGDIQILQAGNKVEIIEGSNEAYFQKISGNHSVTFTKWDKGAETQVKVYLPLHPTAK